MSTDLEGRLVHTDTAAETEALGERLASDVVAGDLILIEGEVGAGKTTMVRGFGRALGVSGRVTSPTFTIGHVYEGTAGKIAHLDLYRIADLAEEDPGLLDDYLTPEAIGIVEWPGAGGEELRARAKLLIEIRHGGSDSREIAIRRGGGGARDGIRGDGG